MGADSKIEWTDHTFNPWVGCTKVSPGCDHCYAEGWAKRSGLVKWGPGTTRRRTSIANWGKPIRWNKEAAAAGVRKRVFCASLADVFDNEVPDLWRDDLWDLIEDTPNLDWLLLTKRIGNVKAMVPYWWERAWWPRNIWLGASIVNQAEADRDIVKLLATQARIHFLSMEPLLDMVDITGHLWGKASPCANCPKDIDCECGAHTRKENGEPAIDWVILGGESGYGARPMEKEWAFSIKEDCRHAEVPFFFKQGSQANWDNFKDFEKFPESLQIRQWPQL